MFVVRQKGCIDAFVFVQVVNQKGCIAFFVCVNQKGCIDALCLFRYPQACPATWRQHCSGTGPPPTRPMPSPCWIPAGNPHSTFLTVGTFNSRPPNLLASSLCHFCLTSLKIIVILFVCVFAVTFICRLKKTAHLHVYI